MKFKGKMINGFRGVFKMYGYFRMNFGHKGSRKLCGPPDTFNFSSLYLF